MNIEFWLAAVMAAGGTASLFCGKSDRFAVLLGRTSCVIGTLLLAINAIVRFTGGEAGTIQALFQLPVCLVGMAAALHSRQYLSGHNDGKQSIYWFFFNLTLSAMICVTLAQTFLLFIIFWELMGLFSFALVGFDWNTKKVQRASWIYLLACEAGGLLLIYMSAQDLHLGYPMCFFTAGMIAFGLKAGFPLLHVWLPEAHPAAPAPVSAVMSGAMIPLGFYGLLRFILPETVSPEVYGWTFLILGILGSAGGILFGLVQKNLKKLLAYSSVENIGIISLGLGLGFLGAAYEKTDICLFGFSGAFLHILNHALLKGTLFLGAGSVYKSVHTLNMDVMGGLMKKMPLTGGLFTMASIGISGLPPFCGFTGELLIYLAAFNGLIQGSFPLFAASFVSAVMLAVTGGLACAAFAKAVSAVFQGEPRTDEARNAAPEQISMVFPMALLMLLSIIVTVAAPGIVTHWILPIASQGAIPMEIEIQAFYAMARFSIISVFLTLITLLLLLLRKRTKTADAAQPHGTWDCGYETPTARMEYTGTAFIQPLIELFSSVLSLRKSLQRPSGLFPEKAGLTVSCADPGEHRFWGPLFHYCGMTADKVHHFQSGRLHLYILVMVLVLLAMLAYGFYTEQSEKVSYSQVKTEAVRK